MGPPSHQHRGPGTPQHPAQVAPRGPKNPWFGMEGTPQTLIPNPCPGQGHLPPAQGTPRPCHPRGLTGTPRALQHTSPTPITHTLLPTPPSWPSPSQPLTSHLPLQTPPRPLWGQEGGYFSPHLHLAPWGPTSDSPPVGQSPVGVGGAHSPCPNPKHHCAQPQPGCSTTFSQVVPPDAPPICTYIRQNPKTRGI